MKKRICFIGHRWLPEITVKPILEKEIRKQLDNGNRQFAMGTHGDFDKLALSVCRQLRHEYPDMIIEVVLTSLHPINLRYEDKTYSLYDDVKTVIYNIEETHFKQRINESNKQMINYSDILICYVNTNYTNSGAKTAYNYAKRKGLEIINLYNETL